MFLTVFALFGGVFVFCSFWIYHYVDLEYESQDKYAAETINAS